MTDQALENAEALLKQLVDRKKALQAEIIGLDDQIARINRFVKDWHAFAEASVARSNQLFVIGSETSENKTPSAHTDRPSKRKNSRKEEVAEAAREIIRERGEPVPRSELYRELVGRGLTIEGTDPEMVLSTMLWRMRDRLVRVKGGGYWLKEVPYPTADYNPDTAKEFDSTLNTPIGEIRNPATIEPHELEDEDADGEAVRLEREIAEHDRRYHAQDAPTISDAEYDALKRRLSELRGENVFG